MYFDKSKLRAASKLESNYDIIVKDYNNNIRSLIARKIR